MLRVDHEDRITNRNMPQTRVLTGLGIWVCQLKSNTPPQTNTSPSSFTKCLTFREGKALVRALATMLLVGQ